MIEISIGEKEKLTNKRTDKQYVTIFVTQYNSSQSSFVPNLRILSQVVAEKCLTEKMSICIRSDRWKIEDLKKAK